jgi:hypothetical protein
MKNVLISSLLLSLFVGTVYCGFSNDNKRVSRKKRETISPVDWDVARPDNFLGNILSAALQKRIVMVNKINTKLQS